MRASPRRVRAEQTKGSNNFSAKPVFGAIPERDCRMLVFPGRGGSWSMAGNGGKMAELGRKSSRETAKGKTSNKNTGKRASRGKKARKAGAERLRLAVDKRLGQNSESLANMLRDQAMGGNVATTRAMVEIAEHKKAQPEPVKKKRGRSLVERLAAEPEWQDDRKDGPAETGGVGVEAAG